MPKSSPQTRLDCALERQVLFLLLAGTLLAPSVRESRAQDLPNSADLRPVFDQYGLARSLQRARPTCSVFTVVGALEFAVAKRQGHTPRLSVEFLNWAGNKACGQQADGGFFSDLWKGYEAYGICTAADYPYAAKFDPAGSPPAEALAGAKTRRGLGLRINWIKEWNVNTGLTESHVAGIKRALADGWPVCAGCRWPKQEKWVEGILQMCPADAVRDGHSVLLVGFREDAAQPGGGVFIFRNTAGAGKDGFMPYEYARAYVNDALWIDFPPRAKETGAVAPRAVFGRDVLLPAEAPAKLNPS